MESLAQFVACHDCDLLHPRIPLPPGGAARCRRCGSLLYRRGKDVINRTVAFTIASLLLFVVANVFPFMEFEIAGRVQVNHLVTGVQTLQEQGYVPLAIVVALTSILAPAFMIAGLLALLVPLGINRTPPYLRHLTIALERMQPWAMMEVYLLGVIVSVIKLSQMANIVLGPACYAFVGLIFTLTAAIAIFDPHIAWERLGTAR